MKTKLNKDGSFTINSVKMEEIGAAAIEAVRNALKAKEAFESLGMEFNEEEFVGKKIILILKETKGNV